MEEHNIELDGQMTPRIPWIKRTFDFGFPVELHHEMLERLRGTSVHVEHLIRTLPPVMWTRRDGEPWSIQENVGHLLGVETRWLGRLDDYDSSLYVRRLIAQNTPGRGAA